MGQALALQPLCCFRHDDPFVSGRHLCTRCDWPSVCCRPTPVQLSASTQLGDLCHGRLDICVCYTDLADWSDSLSETARLMSSTRSVRCLTFVSAAAHSTQSRSQQTSRWLLSCLSRETSRTAATSRSFASLPQDVTGLSVHVASAAQRCDVTSHCGLAHVGGTSATGVSECPLTLAILRSHLDGLSQLSHFHAPVAWSRHPAADGMQQHA